MIVDTFINKDKEFWMDLEIFCMAECCGIDAFDFSKLKLKETIKSYNSDSLIKNLDDLLTFLKQKKSSKISIFLWNHIEDRVLFIKRIENIKQVLLRVSV